MRPEHRRGLVVAVAVAAAASLVTLARAPDWRHAAADRPGAATAAGTPAGTPAGPSPTGTSVPAGAAPAGAPRLPPDSRGLPAVVAHGPRDRPLVALTFDGDMTPVMWHRLDTGAVASYANPAVIDELVRLRVPASFFLTGMWAQRYPTEVRRIAADPMFEVGNHSFAHGAFTPRCYTLSPLPWSGMRADVVRAAAVLQQLVPRLTPYFRFPGGCYDDRARAALAPLRLTVAGFDVASGDAFGRDPDAIVAHTLAAVRDGSIVVMHISAGTAPMTAVALPRIVAGLRTRGFRLVRFSDLVGLDGAARLDGPARLDRMAGSRAA